MKNLRGSVGAVSNVGVFVRMNRLPENKETQEEQTL